MLIEKLVLPICFLIFATVIVVAMARDPQGFVLKDYQTITASIIALGAAGLAYIAAMAKLHFDEGASKENDRRKALGIFLRFYYAVDVLMYEAGELLHLTADPTDPSKNRSISVDDDVAISDLPELQEAWNALDVFPSNLVDAFYEVQNDRYNFLTFRKDNAGEKYRCEYGMTAPSDLTYLRDILSDLNCSCGTALARARLAIRAVGGTPPDE